MTDEEWYPESLAKFKSLPAYILQGKPRCTYKTFEGVRCRQDAAKGDKYCYFHRKVADGLIDFDPRLLGLL